MTRSTGGARAVSATRESGSGPEVGIIHSLLPVRNVMANAVCSTCKGLRGSGDGSGTRCSRRSTSGAVSSSALTSSHLTLPSGQHSSDLVCTGNSEVAVSRKATGVWGHNTPRGQGTPSCSSALSRDRPALSQTRIGTANSTAVTGHPPAAARGVSTRHNRPRRSAAPATRHPRHARGRATTQ